MYNESLCFVKIRYSDFGGRVYIFYFTCVYQIRTGMEPSLDVQMYNSDASESESETNDIDTDSSNAAQAMVMGLKPYQFEPVIDSVKESSSDSDDGSDEDETDETRLENVDWYDKLIILCYILTVACTLRPCGAI